MSAISDFKDFLHALDEHPEWREELRRKILTDELLSLPTIVQDLAQQLGQLTEQVNQLAESHMRVSNDVEWLKGDALEQRYRIHAGAYFASILKRVHALTNDELVTLVEDAEDAGRLSEREANSLLRADLVIRGRCRETKSEAYLAVEVSWGVGISDVKRAADRAELLRKMGKTAFPVVAGTWITPDAMAPAKAHKVWQVTNGKAAAPEAA